MEMKAVLTDKIKECIQNWDKSGIYAVSLFVYDNDDNPCEPTVTLGYNTEESFRDTLEYASDEQEAKWNYAFWLQNEEMVFGAGETQPLVREWLEQSGFTYYSYDEMFSDEPDEASYEGITDAFVQLLVDTVKELHASGFVKEQFGREIPLLIHELEYYDRIAEQNIEANGLELVRDFAEFCKQ